ncbi:hypothetical protein CRP01_33900 [Flavilitoribacter nigricans DSM 23189 = NBRC 102662]|uniref:Magnesium citrate secondary transporter n=2 Tax=Flavilitoribacter TaxID=2762562 RepID=A0A2D0N0F3_FLAN2|nr:hypothetical protein CRP01_33900 [Flavilitoribacter nigricans DSM 23189 = NBRC 102662]
MYLLAGTIFIAHQLLQKAWQISIPLADQYLDPLLCMPLLLGIWQWEKKLLFRHQITTGEIWLLTLLLSLLFEIGFPLLSPNFTADWRDALLYFAGAFLFLTFRTKTSN